MFDSSNIFLFKSILGHHWDKTDYPEVKDVDMIESTPFIPIHLNHIFRVFGISRVEIARTPSRLNSFSIFIIYKKKETYFAVYQASSKAELAGKEN